MNKLVIRNIGYSLVLLTLVIIVILIRTRTPFGRDNTSFTPSAGSEITRIELSSGKEKLILENTGERWTVNGNNEARKSAVGFIQEIIKGMKIKSPVSPEMFESEVTEKGSEPVKVRVFDKKKLVASFYVYKTSSNQYGNMMKLSPGAKPYIMHQPGYEGNIGVIFTLNELYWQPFTVFNILPSEIESVTCENLRDTASSFSITAASGMLKLKGSGRDLQGWDTARVRRYITYFTHVPFESWAGDLTPDSTRIITSSDPAYRLTVTKPDGGKVVLSLWERLKEDRSPDLDRLWARTGENNQLFIVRYFDIDPLLKKKSYFFQE